MITSCTRRPVARRFKPVLGRHISVREEGVRACAEPCGVIFGIPPVCRNIRAGAERVTSWCCISSLLVQKPVEYILRLFPRMSKLTRKFHHSPYPAISPTLSELSTSGKTICITTEDPGSDLPAPRHSLSQEHRISSVLQEQPKGCPMQSRSSRPGTREASFTLLRRISQKPLPHLVQSRRLRLRSSRRLWHISKRVQHERSAGKR
jgi:hypothetical protein